MSCVIHVLLFFFGFTLGWYAFEFYKHFSSGVREVGTGIISSLQGGSQPNKKNKAGLDSVPARKPTPVSE